MSLITTARIIEYDGTNLVVAPNELIDRELTDKEIKMCEIRLDDGRSISAEQRHKIFAIIREISMWSGNEPEYIRMYMTWDFCCKYGCDMFSLSDVDMTTARHYISYLIDFCFRWDVPTKDTLLNRTDDIDKYLYACLYHKKCIVCNANAELHHVDHVGMGFDREQISHLGLRAEAVCRKHHIEAHNIGQHSFDEKYHIYGIRLDEKLCKRYRLKADSIAVNAKPYGKENKENDEN